MAYDYDKLYGETPNALGEANAQVADFFENLNARDLQVLDVGCGQGRDALPIARLGHHVTGVDLSSNGVRDMVETASSEGLTIQGHVADITTYMPEAKFDIILIDRTLHMLDEIDRTETFKRLITHIRPSGWLLLLDEKSNMPAFEDILKQSDQHWETTLNKGGTLFARKT